MGCGVAVAGRIGVAAFFESETIMEPVVEEDGGVDVVAGNGVGVEITWTVGPVDRGDSVGVGKGV